MPEICQPRLLTDPSQYGYSTIDIRLSTGDLDLIDAVEQKTRHGLQLSLSLSLPESANPDSAAERLATIVLCCGRRHGILTTILQSTIIALIGALLTLPPIPQPLHTAGAILAIILAGLVYLRTARVITIGRCKRKIYRGELIPIPGPQKQIIKNIIKNIIKAVRSCSTNKCTDTRTIMGVKYLLTIHTTLLGVRVILKRI